MPKAQVATFVIVGIVLVLAFAVFLIQVNQVSQENEIIEQAVTEQLSDEFLVVRQYVESCLDDVGTTALQIVGAQGGYIYPEQFGIFGDRFSPTNADGFYMTSRSPSLIPYWYFLFAPNTCSDNCEFDTHRPPLIGQEDISIEQQINRYIRENIFTCLNDFAPLVTDGYAVSVTATPAVETYMREDDIRFFFSYPVMVEKNGVTTEISQYEKVVDIPLKRLYEYATLIMFSEMEYNYLEHQATELIALHSGVDRNQLPPMSGSRYEYASTVFWVSSQVKDRISDLLTTYVSGLQVLNSQNYRPVEYDGAYPAQVNRLFQNMVVPISAEDEELDARYNRFNVSFEYLKWPMYFDTNDKGGIIEPYAVSADVFSFFGIQQFKTLYDLSYPVRVVIRDDNALSQSGYTFSFGLESNVRDNRPLTTSYHQFLTEQDPTQQTFLCNKDQRNSGAVSLQLVDAKTGAPISDASVSFTCGEESCAVGLTDVDGVFSDTLPICGGAFLSFVMDGYSSFARPITTSLDATEDLGEIAIEPVRTKKVILKKKVATFGGNTWTFRNTPTDLGPLEKGFVTVTKINTQPGENAFSGVFQYDFSSTDVTLDLVPGTYEVNGNVISDEPFIIPAHTIRKGDASVQVDELVMDAFVSGQISLNEQNGILWTITAEELDRYDAIEFYAVGIDLPGIPQASRRYSHLTEMDNIDDYIVENFNNVLPEGIEND